MTFTRRTATSCFITLLMTAACESEDTALPPTNSLDDVFGGGAGTWVDLTYSFSETSTYWPTADGFQLDTVAYGDTPGGYFYSAFNFSAAEHGGTHLDAPIHFAEGGVTTDQLSLTQLIGPAAVIDVRTNVQSGGTNPNADYLATVEDFTGWEEVHGRIPDGAIVLLHTGWGTRYDDRAAYLGTDRIGPEAVPELHFPGLSPEAAQWLVDERSIGAFGIDTPSIDYGQSTGFEAHLIIYGANIPGFENVAYLDALPPSGGYVIALPMKIAGGSGAPLRIVAYVPEG